MNFRAEISPLQADDTNRVVEVWEASVRATHSFVAEEDIEVFRPLVRGAFPDALTFGCIRDAAGQIVCGRVGFQNRDAFRSSRLARPRSWSPTPWLCRWRTQGHDGGRQRAKPASGRLLPTPGV